MQDTSQTDMNVIRETVRVVKEEIEKDPANYDKYYSSKQAASSAEKKGIGQTAISEYLGGPWKRDFQISQIAEALAPSPGTVQEPL